MKFFLALLMIPLSFAACFGLSGDPADEETPEEDTVEEEIPEENAAEPSPEEEAQPEVNPINITGDAFISNFFNGSYEYRTITLHSSYEYMTDILGEPSGHGSVVDGGYYHYEHIGFNFPESREDAEDLSGLRIDGIIIFPEDLHKQDAVEIFGWPSSDEPSNFRMFYDGDTDNGYYVMMNYNYDDQVTEIILHNKNLEDTDFYEE